MLSENERAVFGAYNPKLLLLRINSTVDVGESVFFKDRWFSRLEITTLFHEMIHHVQAVSSPVGLHLIDLCVSHWNTARNLADTPADEDEKKNLKEVRELFEIYNQPKNIGLINPEIICVEDDGSNKLGAKIDVKIRSEGRKDRCLHFGVGEFMEGMAYLLESMLLKKMWPDADRKDYEEPDYSYKMAKDIGLYFDKSYTDEQLAMMLIFSLRYASPHRIYFKLAKCFANKGNDDGSLYKNLKYCIKPEVKGEEDWVKEMYSQIKENFKKDDPYFGNQLINLYGYSIRKMEERKSRMFPEIEFIRSVTKESFEEDFSRFIADFGGLSILIEDGVGDSDSKVIDVFDEGDFFRDNKGVEVYRVSVHFSYSVVSAGSNVGEDGMPQGKSCCPLVKRCADREKMSNQDLCSSQPWKHPKAVAGGENCPYQLAVHKFYIKNA